jgi:hypothetical protein
MYLLFLFIHLDRDDDLESRSASIWIFSDGFDQIMREDVSYQYGDPHVKQLNDDRVFKRLKDKIKEYRPNIKGRFTINTFGFGADNDAFVMNSIAKLGNGAYYCVKATDPERQASELNKYFADCLQRRLNGVAEELEISMQVSFLSSVRPFSFLFYFSISIISLYFVFSRCQAAKSSSGFAK